MIKVFKNKFFIIALIVATVLTVTAMTLNIIGKGNIFLDAVNIIVHPFQTFGNVLKDSFLGFTAYFTEFNNIKAENAEQKKYIAELESEISNARDLEEKYNNLLSYFSIKQEHMEFDMQPATVIAREAGNFTSIITVNKGTFHEIEKDMPVITPDGIVGYVSEAGFLTSKVVLFTHSSVSVSAYIKRTGVTGIVEGDFEAEKDGLCKLTYLPKDVDLRLGDKIISSGYGGVFPEGLPVGEVVEIEPDDLSQTLTGYIKPAVDFSVLRDVMIIRSFERTFY